MVPVKYVVPTVPDLENERLYLVEILVFHDRLIDPDAVPVAKLKLFIAGTVLLRIILLVPYMAPVLPAKSVTCAVNANAPLAVTVFNGTVKLYVDQLCTTDVGVTVVPSMVNVVPPVNCSVAINDAVMIAAFPTYQLNNGAKELINPLILGLSLSMVKVPFDCAKTV